MSDDSGNVCVAEQSGLQLVQTLEGHQGWVNRLAWDRDGRRMATPSDDETARIWDAESAECLAVLEHGTQVIGTAWSPDGEILATCAADGRVRLFRTGSWSWIRDLEGHTDWAVGLAWSPDGRYLASSSDDKSICLWDTSSWELLHQLRKPHSEPRDNVYSIAWSPDSRLLASAHGDDCIRIWEAASGTLGQILGGHADPVLCVAWSPKVGEPIVVSGAQDHTVRVWNIEKGRETDILAAHTGDVRAVSFSPEGSLLASKSADRTVRLWRRGTPGWEVVCTLEENCGGAWLPGLAFHPDPDSLRLATLGNRDCAVRIWQFDSDVLMGATAPERTTHYRYAKVVVAGDTGVGKTTLSTVLVGKGYQPHESTHVMNILELDTSEVALPDGRQEKRRTLLWDLAGQPMYRLVNRIHLHDAALALVVFDSRSDINPFAGVSYWARALDEANRGVMATRYLVAARIDRGGVQASEDRITKVLENYGFACIFHTSARSGSGVDDLKAEILTSVDWDEVPIVANSELIQETRTFLGGLSNDTVLGTTQDLHARFQATHPHVSVSLEEFAGCLEGLEKTGMILHLSFGGFILLKPRVLCDYCAWLAMAARDNPDRMGYIFEEMAIAGTLRVEAERPLAGDDAEEIVLLATVKEMVHRGIAYRQETEQGPILVFPSEMGSDLPNFPGGYELAVEYTFEGPIKAIYATLAVRLMYSLAFTVRELYMNAALFHAPDRQLCGIHVEYPDEDNDARGRLTVFFDLGVNEDIRIHFLSYVNRHIVRMALKGSIDRTRVYYCADCEVAITNEAICKARKLKRTVVHCPVCGRVFKIDDLAERSAQDSPSILDRIDRESQTEQDRQERLAVFRKKLQLKDYHVFLCHNSQDKVDVRDLAGKLMDWGILPWIDEAAIQPGECFQEEMEKALEQLPAIAVIVGPHGSGPWQQMEYYAAIQRFVERKNGNGRRSARVIPVLLPGVGEAPELPVFLRMLNYVDLRNGYEREQMKRLVDAILEGT